LKVESHIPNGLMTKLACYSLARHKKDARLRNAQSNTPKYAKSILES
jgi:hypothetical protein